MPISHWLPQVMHILQRVWNMDCWTKINPPCVNISINHIRLITNHRDYITFLLHPFMEFDTFLLCVPSLFTEKTLWILFYVSLGRYFTFFLSFLDGALFFPWTTTWALLPLVACFPPEHTWSWVHTPLRM